MDVNELLWVLWQRKVVLLFTLALVLGLGFASLLIQDPVYRATSTVALVPAPAEDGENASDPIFIISQIDVITPLYAEAVRTGDTRRLAQSLQDGRPIGDLAVRTFRGAPIIKIDVESPDPTAARRSAQAVTDALLRRSTNGDIGLSGTLRLSQIDRPQLPTDPVRPQPRLTMLVALLLGLGFGVAAAVVWETLLRKVETPEELAAASGVPCFGEIPADRRVGEVTSPRSLVHDESYREVAEVLRDIRTNIQFTNANVRSVLVTSPEGRHGKTFLSVGLAATLARSGARTLLVDGDLRRGRVAEMLRVERTPGTMDVLHGMPVDQGAKPTDLETMSVMPGGELEDDPGELLESSFFKMLYDAEAAYDITVIDGTPLVPINDARLMARYVSCVILVVSAGAVTKRQVRTAVDRLAIIGVTPTAVVVNNSKVRRRASYYRYLRPPERV